MSNVVISTNTNDDAVTTVNSMTKSDLSGSDIVSTRQDLIDSDFRSILSQEFHATRGLNLFNETTEATIQAIGCFAVANLRTLAYRKLISDEDAAEVMKLPMSGKRLTELYLKHKDDIDKIRSSDFVELAERYTKRFHRSGLYTTYFVGDENQDSECVHVIGRDHFRKTIVLTFRGTVQLSDWYQNLKLVLVHEPNPLYGQADDQQKEVGIHWGFRNYLMGPAENPFLKTVTKLLPNHTSKQNIQRGTSQESSEGGATSQNSRLDQQEESFTPEETAPTTTITSTNTDTRNVESNATTTNSAPSSNPKETTQPPTRSYAETTTNRGRSHNSDCSATGSTFYPPNSKIEVILHQLRYVKQKYPNDRIYIAGHSLGGALALISSLYVASDPTLNQLPDDAPEGFAPVNCFAIADPKPGNSAFAMALHHLERTNKLRCCVVHNTRDMIPMTPISVLGRDQGTFCHPGFRLLLYKDRFEIGRSLALEPDPRFHNTQNVRQFVNWVKRQFTNQKSSKTSQWMTKHDQDAARLTTHPTEATTILTRKRLDTHTYREYLDRMLAQADCLSNVFLNDLHEEILISEEKN